MTQQQSFYKKPASFSLKEPWEKFCDTFDTETPETNDATETFESCEFSVYSNCRYNEDEIQRFLEGIDRRYARGEELEKALKEAKYETQHLHAQVRELEGALELEKMKADEYFEALQQLEKENDHLSEENSKLSEENKKLKQKVHGIQRHIQAVKEESCFDLLKGGARKFDSMPSQRHKERTKQFKRIKSEMHFLEEDEDSDQSRVDEEVELEEFPMDENEHNYFDDLWIAKLRFLKEKLATEQLRCESLEQMIITQNEIIEETQRSLERKKEQKRTLEIDEEKMKNEINKLTETRLKEKAKIDNLITFCDLIDSCSFTKDELIDKISNLPSIISSFLKGNSDTINFNTQSSSSSSSNLVSSIKKYGDLLDSYRIKAKDLQGVSFEEFGRIFDSIKDALNKVIEFLSRVLPTIDQNILITLEKHSQAPSNFENKDLKTENQISAGPAAEKEDLLFRQGFSSPRKGYVFTKAIQNKSSLLWHLGVKMPK